MKKITDIYKEYKIPLGLQTHMLRVAAVAYVICDNLDKTVNKDDVVTACLLHDMGNIIKSDLMVFPSFLEPEGIEYWQAVKDDYMKRYGTNEHTASMKIIKELERSQAVLDIVNLIDFATVPDVLHARIETKISMYADCRVAPHGVMSVTERLTEGRKRYAHKTNLLQSQWDINDNAVQEIEKQIFAHCKIKPEDITDEAVAPIIEKLRDFVIK